jgi:N-acetylmuramoyl-L-alanine amidase
MLPPILVIDVRPDRESAELPAASGSAADILARTLWGEARNEPVRGKEAVAALVVNRVRRAQARGGYWWGNSIIEVCRRPEQFPCWHSSGPNAAKCAAVTVQDRNFRACLRIARRAIAGVIDDPTAGATHYHAKGVLPPWTRGQVPSAEIGNTLFYRDVE